MSIKIKYKDGALSNPLQFNTELDEFLKLVLANEPQRTVENKSNFDVDEYEFWIVRGTYGENYRGLISIKADSRGEHNRIEDIVMSYHNRPHYGWEVEE